MEKLNIVSAQSKHPKVGIVILNYLKYDYTIKCVEALNSINYKNYFVILVDNKSPNDSADKISNYINNNIVNYDIELIISDRNNGYSYGNNIGSKRANERGADYILVMNNDIEIIDNNIIEKLVEYMQLNLNVSMVGPGIIQKSGLIELAGYPKRIEAVSYIFRNLLYPIIIAKNKMKRRKKNNLVPSNVYSVSGSFFLIRSQVFKEVEYFDENIFLYGEEMIIGEKLYKKGKQVIFLPQYKVFHNHSVTIGSLYKNREIELMQYASHKYYFENYRQDINKITVSIVKISEIIKINFYSPVVQLIKKLSGRININKVGNSNFNK